MLRERKIIVCPFAKDWKLALGRRQWHPTLVLLPEKSHGRRSLVSCSPWGREESDTTERLHFHFSLSCIGEGNGSPLQCSCLENPRDRSLVGCHLWGRTESDMTDVTLEEEEKLALSLSGVVGVLLPSSGPRWSERWAL